MGNYYNCNRLVMRGKSLRIMINERLLIISKKDLRHGIRQHVKENRKKMQKASSKHKQVPYGMVEEQFFPFIKNHAPCVCQPTGQHPIADFNREGLCQRENDDNNHPPHCQVHDYFDFLEF